MDDSGLLAVRLRWLRREQGLTLEQLAERSGHCVSYICQLEKGARENPTKQVVEALARALGVRPAFLMGEAPGTGQAGWAGAQAGVDARTIGVRIHEHLTTLAQDERERLSQSTPTQRFSLVVRFLLDHYPESFTPNELAFRLGMSLPALAEFMADKVDLSPRYMEQLATLTGVPVRFFAFGTLEAPPPAADLPDMLRYVEAIRLAMARNLTPDLLKDLIRGTGDDA